MATMWRTPCAFARVFIGKTGQILNNTTDLLPKLTLESLSIASTRKYSSYGQSPLITKIRDQYEFEVVKKPSEWAYVERLLPFDTIPKVTPKDHYPSGWVPPKEEAKNHPYFLQRSKHHNIPVYLDITYRGMRKLTHIKKIEGDIWLFNSEIKDFLKNKYDKYIETRVHEPARVIEIKGDYVEDVRQWAYSKGF